MVLFFTSPIGLGHATRDIAIAEKLALMRSHFLNPAQIARLFPVEARLRVETQENTAWVIVEK